MLLCYFACFKISVTAVPINYRLKSDEIRYIVNHSGPTILISEAGLFPEVEHTMGELWSVEKYFLVDWRTGEFADTEPFPELLGNTAPTRTLPEEYGDSDAVILYTSGTTGKPKGATMTHSNLALHTDNHCRLVDYRTTDITLVSLALSNNFAFSHQILAALRAGATLEILPRFGVHEVLERIERTAVTMLYMMPVMYHSLVRLAETLPSRTANRLRLAIVAGDTTPFVVFDGFEKQFCLEMCEGIGMTETQIYTLNPLSEGKKLGSVGNAVPYQQVSVQNDRGQILPAGEVGEIAVKSGIVTSGYLNNARVTAESFRDGWFLTGDLGCFDDDDDGQYQRDGEDADVLQPQQQGGPQRRDIVDTVEQI